MLRQPAATMNRNPLLEPVRGSPPLPAAGPTTPVGAVVAAGIVVVGGDVVVVTAGGAPLAPRLANSH
jgi:hypothetical protein